MYILRTLFLALLAAAPSLCCAAPKLKTGDPAPALKAGEWVQGEPVKEFSRDNVYVVEFWATWCGPCVASIPHLDELHEELKDKGFVFIGQNCRENDAAAVKKFVGKMGEKMSYRVALDDSSTDKSGYMTVNWLQAAEQPGIPCAFVVGKDGKIAWIGHPMLLNAGMLKEVAAGTFDAKKAADEQEKQQAGQAGLMAKTLQLNAATEAKDWDKAIALIEEMEKATPGAEAQFAALRVAVGVEKGDDALVEKYADKFLDGGLVNTAGEFDKVAWNIVTKLKKVAPAALSLAEKASNRAVEKSGGKDSGILKTKARILFLKGKKDEAVQAQEQALSVAADDQKAALSKDLEEYKNDRLPAVEDAEAEDKK